MTAQFPCACWLTPHGCSAMPISSVITASSWGSLSWTTHGCLRRFAMWSLTCGSTRRGDRTSTRLALRSMNSPAPPDSWTRTPSRPKAASDSRLTESSYARVV